MHSPFFSRWYFATFPALWVIWAILTRGGLTLRLMGLGIVRADGRPAARWQCAWRALIVWVPIAALLYACVWVKAFAPEQFLLQSGLWWLAAALVLGDIVLAIHRPIRALHDRLAGTHLVPQ